MVPWNGRIFWKSLIDLNPRTESFEHQRDLWSANPDSCFFEPLIWFSQPYLKHVWFPLIRHWRDLIIWFWIGRRTQSAADLRGRRIWQTAGFLNYNLIFKFKVRDLWIWEIASFIIDNPIWHWSQDSKCLKTLTSWGCPSSATKDFGCHYSALFLR
jgi:hypothetical protein